MHHYQNRWTLPQNIGILIQIATQNTGNIADYNSPLQKKSKTYLNTDLKTEKNPGSQAGQF